MSLDFSQSTEVQPQFDEGWGKLNRHEFDVLMTHASTLIANEDYRLAIHLLRTALMRFPNHQDALLQMGFCLREIGLFEEAIKCFKALIKNGDDVHAKLMLAETYYLMERDEIALATYRDALRTVINDQHWLFDTYKNMGNIHVRSGDFEGAEEYYNKAYAIEPLSDVLMVNFGTLEVQRENLADAVERFRAAVELNSKNDRAWVGLAMVHRTMGDHELAWANLERALDMNPNNRTALKLAIAWGDEDYRFEPAIRSLQTYISDRGGEDAEMCFSLAKIFVATGRLHDARIEMERVLSLDPGIEGALNLQKILDVEIERSNQSQTRCA